MKKIEVFKNIVEINKKYNLGSATFLGHGTRGFAYKLDGEVLKMLNRPFYNPCYQKVITTSDFKLDSIILPKRLLVIKGCLVGYIADYFPNDILSLMKKHHDRKFEIELDKFKRSRELVQKDLDVLTEAGIYAFDLQWNLLFDGTRLRVIDTADYRPRKNEDFTNDEILIMGVNNYLKKFNPDYEIPSEDYIVELKKIYGPKIYSK